MKKLRTKLTKGWLIILLVAILCLAAPVAVYAGVQINFGANMNIGQVSGYTGGFSYTYPLEVPKGPGNITPQLTLVYNSVGADQSGDGNRSHTARLGKGWSLSGLMSVEKDSGGTYYLIMSGTSAKLLLGSDGYYHTESENFARIKKESNYWWLKTKDGTYYRLGYNADARHNNDGDYAWDADFVQDIYGNTMTVQYYEYAIPIYGYEVISCPVKIMYNNITIDLNIYADSSYVYVNGVPAYVYDYTRYTGIVISAGSSRVRSYALGYNGVPTSEFNLSSIQVYGSDGGTAEPATTFAYSFNNICLSGINNGVGGSQSIEYNEYGFHGTRHKVTSQITSDGMGNNITNNYQYLGERFEDGEFRGFSNVKVTDGAGVLTETNYYQDAIYKGLPSTVEIKNGSSLFKKSVYTYTHRNTLPSSGMGKDMKLITVAGDGSVFGADLAGGYGFKWNGSSWDSIGGVMTAMSAKNGNDLWVTGSDDTCRWANNITDWLYLSGTEMKKVAVGYDGTVFGINNNAANNIYQWNGSGWSSFGPGGTLKDISVRNAGEIWGVALDDSVYKWMNGYWQAYGKPVYGGQTRGVLRVSVGSDGAVYATDSSNLVVKWTGSWTYLSGACKEISTKNTNELWGIGSYNDVYCYNGTWTQVGTTKMKLISVAGDGTVFAADLNGTSYKWNGSSWSLVGGGAKSIAAKNGNDLWVIGSTNALWRWGIMSGWYHVASPKMLRVAAGYDGSLFGINNNATNNIYQWNGSGWSSFTPGGTLKDISVRNSGEIWGIGLDNAVWKWVNGAWQGYGKPVYNDETRNVLHVSVGSDGAVYATDAYNLVVKWTASGWDYSIGGACKEISAKNTNELWGIGTYDHVYRYAGGVWTAIDGGEGTSGNAYFVSLSQQDDYIYDGDTTYTRIQTQYTYDTYGNLTNNSSMGDVSNGNDQVYTNTEYINDTTNWILGVPQRTYTQNSGGSTVAESWYYYSDTYNGTVNYGSAKKFLRKTENALVIGSQGNTTNPTNELTYDQWGNILTTRDGNGNITTTTYDGTYHVFAISVSNAKGHTTGYSYYGVNAVSEGSGVFGQLQRIVDANGRFSFSMYDPLGRLTATWRDGYSQNAPEVSYEYQYWQNYTSPNRTVTKRRISPSEGTINTYTYTDGLGRTIQVQTPSEQAGVMLLSGTVDFESRGLVYAKYIQYKVASSGGYLSPNKQKPTYYYYDTMRRCYQTTYPDQSTSTTYYQDLFQADTDQSGKTVNTYYDAYGRVAAKENAGGGPVTRYSYDALGLCISTWDRAGNTNTTTYDALGRKTRSVDVDMGTWTYAYDKNGNLISQTDAKGKTTSMSYDALNRVLTKVCTNSLLFDTSINIQYTYDSGANGIGRLYREVNTSNIESVTTTYAYNAWGDITQTVKTVGGVDYTTTTGIDMMERPAYVTYPDGSTVYYTYNGNNGSLSMVGSTAGGNQYLRGVSYDSYGLVTGKTLGNGVNYYYEYNYNSFWVQHICADGPAGRVMSYWYNHESNRNVTNVTDDVNNYNWGYSYDFCNRLTRAYRGTGINPSSNIYDRYYTYDNTTGNIATFEGRTYTYSTAHKHAVTSDGANTYAYDNNGNMTSGSGRTITWSMDNKPVSVVSGGVTTRFVYDASGNKVKKKTSSSWRVYINGIYEKDSAGASECFINLDGVTVKKKADGSVFYILTDHLGSASVILNSAGAIVTREYYQPFGSDDTIGALIGETDSHKFTGQEQIAETGLYYYGGRFYDTSLGRFISADPFVGINRYAYCDNNPINATDPSGYTYIPVLSELGSYINDQSSADKCNARYEAIDQALLPVTAPVEQASASSASEARYNDLSWQANRVGNNVFSDQLIDENGNEVDRSNLTYLMMPSFGVGPGNGASALSLLKQAATNPWTLINLGSTGVVKYAAAKSKGATDHEALLEGVYGVALTVPASIGPGMVKYSGRVAKGSIADIAVNHVVPAEYRAIRAKILNPQISVLDAHWSQGTNLGGSLAFGLLGGQFNKYSPVKISQFAISQCYSSTISNWNFYLEQSSGKGLYTVEGLRITAGYFGI